MASSGSGTDGGVSMADVLQALKTIQDGQSRLATEVETLSHRLDALPPSQVSSPDFNKKSPSLLAGVPTSPVQTTLGAAESDVETTTPTKEAVVAQKSGFTSRIILT